jgi:hypothetical protein
MGDGQHVWAAAEWIVMMRNLFVREEGDALVIGSGVRREWLSASCGIERTLAPQGMVSISFTPKDKSEVALHVQGEWRSTPPRLEIRVPGYSTRPSDNGVFRLTPASAH